MKIIWGCSRWTNSIRSQARHIADEKNKPLCGDKRRRQEVSYVVEEDSTPTCKACLRIWEETKKALEWGAGIK